jgi:tight adherence protein C
MDGRSGWLKSIDTGLEQFGIYVKQIDAWRSFLPHDKTTPGQAALIVMGVFLSVTLVLYLVGRLLIGFGRNRIPEKDQVGSLKPLSLGFFTDAFAWVFPVTKSTQDKLRKELVQAGYYHNRALEEFLSVRNFAIIAWTLFLGFAVVLLANPQENLTPRILLIGGTVLAFIYALPRLVLGQQAKARKLRMQYALPDALDMINMTVSGGLPLRKAIERVGKELKSTHPDIACELAIVDRQSEAGSLDQALRQFAARLDTPDVSVLASMVRHAEKLGGSVAVAFRDFADSIRRTRRQTAEERGNRSSVQMLFPVVFCLAPPIYILLLGPAALELRNFIQRETRPGGALSQSISDATASANINRPSANQDN